MNPTSEEIKKQEVIDQLAWNDSVDANEIKVTVKGSTVFLEGKVPSYAAKKAAEEDTYLIAGVSLVENHLEVEHATDSILINDSEVKSNLEAKLLWNSQLNAGNIKVHSENGVVTLSGIVDSYWEKKLAEKIAGSATGVISVNNELKVTTKKAAMDLDIENDIKSAYTRSALVDETSVEVSVNDGHVHLSGIVPFYAMKKEILEIAQNTSGVVDVVDEVTIG